VGGRTDLFSGHIVKQHQFSALCNQRGWQFKKLGNFDAWNCPRIEVPHLNLRAEFKVEELAIDGNLEREGTGPDDGMFKYYIQTGELAFHRTGPGGADRDLTKVSPRALSELMRDVDLFVSITSVGNDLSFLELPADDENHDLFYQYVIGFSRQDLSAPGKARQQVLQAMLPRLYPDPERFSFTDRFLRVRGDRASYKIHLNTGQVFIEPEDRILNFQKAKEDAASKLPYKNPPFEGDNTLTVIVNRARYLADDRKIKNPLILSHFQPQPPGSKA
jgi:hypothetical protein